MHLGQHGLDIIVIIVIFQAIFILRTKFMVCANHLGKKRTIFPKKTRSLK